MNIGDFLHSRKWRTIQNYTYSFGASVVLIGALAKLEHWTMASGFLMTGLGMEALIFFISAFEPLLETPDWKRVYPQLREGDEPDKILDKYAQIDEKFPINTGMGTSTGTSGGGGLSIKDLPAEQVKKLNESFEKLSEAAMGIKNIANATVATDNFVDRLKEASQSIGLVVESNKNVSGVIEKNVTEITESYKSAAHTIHAAGNKAADSIDQSVNVLSDSVKQAGSSIKATGDKASASVDQTINDLTGAVKTTIDGFKTSGNKFSAELEKSGAEFSKQLNTSTQELTGSYKKVAESLAGGFKGLEKSSKDYVENIEKINKKLAALNTAYEMHLKGAGELEKVVNDYSAGIGEIGKLLHVSVEETKKFNDNTKEINTNIQELNKVYGRMLGALNTKKSNLG